MYRLRLTEMRLRAGYDSMAQAAKALGMSASTYANYETGRRGITLDLACDFADRFRCTLDEMCGRARPDSSPDLMRLYDSMSDQGKDALLAAAIGLSQAYPKSAAPSDSRRLA